MRLAAAVVTEPRSVAGLSIRLEPSGGAPAPTLHLIPTAEAHGRPNTGPPTDVGEPRAGSRAGTGHPSASLANAPSSGKRTHHEGAVDWRSRSVGCAVGGASRVSNSSGVSVGGSAGP